MQRITRKFKKQLGYWSRLYDNLLSSCGQQQHSFGECGSCKPKNTEQDEGLTVDAKLVVIRAQLAACREMTTSDALLNTTKSTPEAIEAAYKKAVVAHLTLLDFIRQTSADNAIADSIYTQLGTLDKQVQEDLLVLYQHAVSAFQDMQTHTASYPAQDTKIDIFLKKTCANYCKLLSELSGVAQADREKWALKARTQYEAARRGSSGALQSTDTLLLEVELGYAVFLAEIEKKTQEACVVVKQAFDRAYPYLQNTDDTTYQASSRVLILLREYLTIWTNQLTAQRDALDEFLL